MYSNPRFRAAQVVSDWIDPENLLTGAEARAERQFHHFLESLCRPKPSPLAVALACVLAIPPASRGRASEHRSGQGFVARDNPGRERH